MQLRVESHPWQKMEPMARRTGERDIAPKPPSYFRIYIYIFTYIYICTCNILLSIHAMMTAINRKPLKPATTNIRIRLSQ